MDLLQIFLADLSQAFARPIVMSPHKKTPILSPAIALSDLKLRREGPVFLFSGTLELTSPLDKPLQVPGNQGNPSLDLGFFLAHTYDFKGSFENKEHLEIFSFENKNYATVSIQFHDYFLSIPESFQISEIPLRE